MKPDSDKQWKRFLEYSELARAKPTFDAEEREWRLLIAERIHEVLRAARDGGDWHGLLNMTYRQGGLFRFISSARAHKVWFDACAAADPEAARSALAAFLEPDQEAEERFASFARALEEAEPRGVKVETTPAMTLGSACNFAVEPLSVPIMRPGFFRTLAQILGYKQSEPASIADAYAQHLAFARWLRSRMEESGFPIRDMIDLAQVSGV